MGLRWSALYDAGPLIPVELARYSLNPKVEYLGACDMSTVWLNVAGASRQASRETAGEIDID